MSTEGNNQTAVTDKIEALRLILERQQLREVTYEEAREVGESLICFFEILADNTFAEQIILEDEGAMA